MLTDRTAYTKPAFPSSWPVGTIITDPVFGSRVMRVTDPNVYAGAVNASFGGPSAGYQNQWSANATKFYVIGSSGGIGLYSFNASTMTHARIAGSGDNGLQISSGGCEPQFSYNDDAIIYCTGENATHHTPIIRAFNFSGQTYTNLLDLWPMLNGLGKTIIDTSYAPNIFSSKASPEKIVTMCPNVGGDENYLAVVFEVGNPSQCSVLDTMASTVSVNGGAFTSVGSTVGVHLHGVDIDFSGRYVCLFTASADFNPYPASGKAKKYIWDTQTNVVTPMTLYPDAHTAMGWNRFLNMDGPHPSPYDNLVVSLRDLANVGTVRECLKVPLGIGETYRDGHISWHNAKETSLEPMTLESYRAQDGTGDSPTNTAPWQAWDDEIISIPTDDIDTNVYRHCHHHSIPRDDNDVTSGPAFYFQPRTNKSQDGKWALFSSNGDKTLGTQLGSSAPMTKRYDVFMVELTFAHGRAHRRSRRFR